VAHAVSQLLHQLVAVLATVKTVMFVVMSVAGVMVCILGAALVAAGRALVAAQYDVHAPALPHVGDGTALYPGADRVHGDAEGLGGLGYR
jgi:hypothetical protein